MSRWLRPTSGKRIAFFLISDLIISLLTLFIAYELRFNLDVPHRFWESFWLVFAILFTLKAGALALYKSYFIVWRFFGFEEAKALFKAHFFAYGLFSLFYLIAGEWIIPFPRSVIGIDFFLSLVFITVLRSLKRLLLGSSGETELLPAVIIGANARAAAVIRSALDGEIPYYPVCILATPHESGNVGSYISNIRVQDAAKLEKIIAEREVKAAILTSALPQPQLKTLVETLGRGGVTQIKRVRLLGNNEERLEDLSIEELLARRPQDLDTGAIADFIAGKRVLITGAGGSIGSEIARQCERFDAAALLLVDHSEFNLYQISEDLPEASPVLLNVTDGEDMRACVTAFRPDLILHAAAYKHVPLCEANPEAAVRNNVLGTKNVIDAAVACRVPRLVIISTDKAVRPTNVMGATKRVTELYAQNVRSITTEIACVRFGNVLGSSGSVIPKFKRQIESGGPVTVTHPDITRYFMLIPEACQLVLQAAAIAKGGELFILDMGSPVKIADLARQMIRLYGKEHEIEVLFSGLRPGEKLYEELLIDEREQKTRYSSILIAGRTDYPIAQLDDDITTLLTAPDKIDALQRIVPEFEHKP